MIGSVSKLMVVFGLAGRERLINMGTVLSISMDGVRLALP
jgi:hypothetical protein